MGLTTPTATTKTGRRPPQSGTPGRGQHLRRRAPPQGDLEERTGTVGTPGATPSKQGGGEERTGAVGTSAAAPPNQVDQEGKIGTTGSLAAAPPKQVVREDKTGAADTPAAAPPNHVHREEKTGAVDTPAAAGLGAGWREATGAETTNAANELWTPHGSPLVAAAAPGRREYTTRDHVRIQRSGSRIHHEGDRLAGTTPRPNRGDRRGKSHDPRSRFGGRRSQSRSKRGREHSPQRQRDPPRTPKRNRHAYTIEDRLKEERGCTKEPPKTTVGSPGHPEGRRKRTARFGANTPPPTCGGDHVPKPLSP